MHRKKSDFGWQRKKFKIKASQIPRNAAYRGVREIPRDAAQRRYWTFCEAINFLPIRREHCGGVISPASTRTAQVL
jgi:hypothetical protein